MKGREDVDELLRKRNESAHEERRSVQAVRESIEFLCAAQLWELYAGGGSPPIVKRASKTLELYFKVQKEFLT